MKIAWFIPRYHPCLGGAEAFGRAIVRRFVAAGHDVDVFTSNARDLWYFNDPKRRKVDAPECSEVDGANVHRLPIRHIPLRRYLIRLIAAVPNWSIRCRFAPYMPIMPGLDAIRGDYDAVFGIGFPYTVFSFAAHQAARAAGAPLVLIPFLHLSTPGDPVNRHYTKPHQIRLLNVADLVVSPTTLESKVLGEWGLPAARRLVLPMAIEPAEVTGGDGTRFRARLKIPESCRLVGQLGALDPNKGSTDLILAVQRLNNGRTELIHLVLAGASSPDFEAFAAKLPEETSRWLSIVGALDPAEVPDFYDALDIFAMPSRTDSFGIVYLEAWANALPVVAAAAGGVTEVVDDGRTGLLVPFGDLDALADRLGRLVADPALAQRLGAAGRQRIDADGGWDDRFALLFGRVQSLGSNRGGRGRRTLAGDIRLVS